MGGNGKGNSVDKDAMMSSEGATMMLTWEKMLNVNVGNWDFFFFHPNFDHIGDFFYARSGTKQVFLNLFPKPLRPSLSIICSSYLFS